MSWRIAPQGAAVMVPPYTLIRLPTPSRLIALQLQFATLQPLPQSQLQPQPQLKSSIVLKLLKLGVTQFRPSPVEVKSGSNSRSIGDERRILNVSITKRRLGLSSKLHMVPYRSGSLSAFSFWPRRTPSCQEHTSWEAIRGKPMCISDKATRVVRFG